MKKSILMVLIFMLFTAFATLNAQIKIFIETDLEGNVIGGKNTLTGSVEIEKAIGESWGLAVFYDLGNAFNDWGNFALAQGAGIGGRYYSPVGPIRLDIARQINQPRPDIRIHFSIGFGL